MLRDQMRPGQPPENQKGWLPDVLVTSRLSRPGRAEIFTEGFQSIALSITSPISPFVMP